MNTLIGVQSGIELFTGGSVTVAENDITRNKVIKYDQRSAGTGVRIFSLEPEESIRNNTVSGNMVLGFGSDVGVTTFDTNPAHFKVKGNKVGFATPGN